MEFTHLREGDYDIKPWKNGLGTTADLFMAPAGATHDTFDLRFSMAPIVEPGPFSSFPSADRRITLIEGNGLDLNFGDHSHHLTPLAPFGFDTELAPMGTPVNGPVRVVNVMARRPKWHIEECNVVSCVSEQVDDGSFCFLFVIDGEWEATGSQQAIARREVLLAKGGGRLEIAPSENGQAIFAKILPA